MSFLLDYNPGTQQWGYPRRGAVLSGTCIVHTAECAADNVGEDTSAEGCANMIANRADYGSYHRLVDSDSIIDMIPFEYEAWQDSETNPWAVGISAALRTSDWLNMPADRADRVYRNLAICAAEFVRHMAGKGVAVPLRRISGSEARAGVPGFCAHGDSGIARTDPGADFDWSRFFNYTAEALTMGGIATQGTTELAATGAGNEGEGKMIVLATDGKSPQVWIGDGILRRPVWSLDTMNALQWLDANKVLGPFYKGGEVQTIPDLNSVGIDIMSLVGKDVNGR